MPWRRTRTRVSVYPILELPLNRWLYCVIYIFHNFPNRLNCSSSYTGLLNSLANPDNYHDLDCPCNDFGAPICPANSTQQGELYHYRSVSYDEFYDLAAKNISLWILRTYEELKDLRFISFNWCFLFKYSNIIMPEIYKRFYFIFVKDWRFRIRYTTSSAVFELHGDAKKCYRKFREGMIQN
jgi:hypothetical protein